MKVRKRQKCRSDIEKQRQEEKGKRWHEKVIKIEEGTERHKKGKRSLFVIRKFIRIFFLHYIEKLYSYHITLIPRKKNQHTVFHIKNQRRK